MEFTIWIDADGCPRAVREIVFRASNRLQIPVRLVANRVVETPLKRPLISSVVVSSGIDEADDWIAKQVDPDDIVITGDIPLAARVVEKAAVGIDYRGDIYTEANVRSRLSMRDFMASLREQGVRTGGPPPFGARAKEKFANALDGLLTKRS